MKVWMRTFYFKKRLYNVVCRPGAYFFMLPCTNTMRPRQNGRQFTDVIDNTSHLARVMVWQAITWTLLTKFYTVTKPLQEQHPDSTSLKDLADAFGEFFIMKIKKIRTKLDSQNPEPIMLPRMPVKDLFLSFQPLSEDDVRQLIKQLPYKQCSSDPILTYDSWRNALILSFPY